MFGGWSQLPVVAIKINQRIRRLVLKFALQHTPHKNNVVSHPQ